MCAALGLPTSRRCAPSLAPQWLCARPCAPTPNPPRLLVSCRCLGTAHVLPCHEAASAPTPPSCVHPAFLRPHTQPGCPGRRGPSAPRPCTHPPPEATGSNCQQPLLVQKTTQNGKASSPLQNQGLSCFVGSSRPPALPRPRFRFFISNRHWKKTTYYSRRFRLTDGEKASGASETSASSFGH